MFEATRVSLAFTAIVCVSACGGSSGSFPAPSPANTPISGEPAPIAPPATISSIFGLQGSGPITSAQIVAATQHLGSLFDAADAGLVTIARPEPAQVTLNGLIGNNAESGMTIGRLTLDADLVLNTVTGNATDFSVFESNAGQTTEKVEDLSGELLLSGGVISGNSLSADVSGVLTGQSDITYDAQINGDFLDVQNTIHAIGKFTGTSQIGTDSPLDLENGSFLVSE